MAINVGDATNVLAMGLLLGNVETLGVRKALLVLREVERMARESAEGQAIELGWIADERFDLEDRDYVRMAYKKTCWYTVIAPLRIGVICGSAPGAGPRRSTSELLPLDRARVPRRHRVPDQRRPAQPRGRRALYGKETSGDLWEGKRTVMLLHFLRTAQAAAASPRAAGPADVRAPRKTPDEVAWLLGAMIDAGLARARARAGASSTRSARSSSTTARCRSSRETTTTAASSARCCAT